MLIIFLYVCIIGEGYIRAEGCKSAEGWEICCRICYSNDLLVASWSKNVNIYFSIQTTSITIWHIEIEKQNNAFDPHHFSFSLHAPLKNRKWFKEQCVEIWKKCSLWKPHWLPQRLKTTFFETISTFLLYDNVSVICMPNLRCYGSKSESYKAGKFQPKSHLAMLLLAPNSPNRSNFVPKYNKFGKSIADHYMSTSGKKSAIFFSIKKSINR